MPTFAPPCSPSSILVVDDDPDICMALTDLLGNQGHHVDAVGTGTEAMERVTGKHFDVVFLDVGLPDIDGLAVLSRLITLKPHLPVIILTAYTSLGPHLRNSNSPGAYAALRKPYKVNDLITTLGEALGRTGAISEFEHHPQPEPQTQTSWRSLINSPASSIVYQNPRDPNI